MPASVIVRQEPMMVIGAAVNLAVVMTSAVLSSSVLHLTSDQMAAVATISTALTSAITAFIVVPVNLAVINSVVSTVLVASAAFGLHMQPASIALVAASVSTLLSYLIREKVTPVASIKR